MNLLINLLSVFFVLVALLMVLVILMQRPKSEGLGAAFGGAVTENIFGAQTTNVLVKFTTWLAGIFFALTLGLSVLYAHRGTGGESAFRRELMKQQTPPATSPAPANAQPSPGSSPASSPLSSPPSSQTSPASSPAATAQPTATP
ncbi:MAG TPA: preprotein translocase subunit SecG [Candidatus Udaeobacter sp.]|jgi:preprotein translocase subunit SecG